MCHGGSSTYQEKLREEEAERLRLAQMAAKEAEMKKQGEKPSSQSNLH